MASTALTVSIEESSPVTRTLKVEVPVERVHAARGNVLREFSRQARVPGFRPGKVPPKVIETNYKADIERSVLERLVRESLDEAIAKLDVPVLNIRDILPEALATTTAFKYSAVVEVPPKIEVKGYKKLKALRPCKKAEAQDVDAVLTNISEHHATFRPALAEDSIALGDRVTLNYSAFENGQLIANSKVENHETQIGTGALHPKFEQQLAKAKVGDQLKFAIDFGEHDAPNAQLKNKKVDFEVEVVALQKRELPQLNDEFVTKMLNGTSLAALRERIEADLNAAYARQGAQAVEEQIIQQLLELHNFALPESVVVRHREALTQEAADRLLQQGYPKKLVQDLLPMIFKDQAQRAEQQVRLAFLLEAIAKAEGITISDASVEDELARLAELEEKTKEAVITQAKQQGRFENYRSELRNRQALALVIENANIKDVTPEVFKKHQEQQQAERAAAQQKAEGENNAKF